MENKDPFKVWHCTCNVLMVLLALLFIWFMYCGWSQYRDSMLKQVEKNESKASFKAQIVTTDNGVQVFIREIDGKIYGDIVNQEP